LITLNDAVMTERVEEIKQGLTKVKQAESFTLEFDIFEYPFQAFAKFKATVPGLGSNKCHVTVILTKTQGVLFVFRRLIKENSIQFFSQKLHTSSIMITSYKTYMPPFNSNMTK
jgi:hypothetical protein